MYRGSATQPHINTVTIICDISCSSSHMHMQPLYSHHVLITVHSHIAASYITLLMPMLAILAQRVAVLMSDVGR